MSTNVQLFKRILTRNVFLPIVLGTVSCLIFAAMINYLISVDKWVEHTDRVLGASEVLQKQFIDAETGMRGFMVTRDEKFLEPYNNTMSKWKRQKSDLRDLVSDNPVQVQRVDDLGMRFEAWLKYTDEMREDLPSIKLPEMVRRMEDNKHRMDEMRGIFSELQAVEQGLREKRSVEAHEFAQTFLFVMVLFTFLTSILLALWGRKQLLNLSGAYEGILEEKAQQNDVLMKEQWLKSNDIALSDKMLGRKGLHELCEQILLFLANLVHAEAAVLYVSDENAAYFKLASIGTAKDTLNIRQSFGSEETLLGRAVKERKPTLYSDLPANYMTFASGLGSADAKHLLIAPAIAENEINAVLELGFIRPVDPRSMEFISSVSEKIGLAIQSVKYKEKLENLLHEVQVQSEELQAQQEELRVSNEELDNQARLLKESQVRTEAQNAELEQTNEQLMVQAKILEEQKDQIDRRNQDLMATREEIELKADELQKASQYKSEFLANMSHELRTPLNSSLILAQLLTENRDGNLSEQQVNFARQIVKSGNDLLLLINDILDLSKVESGMLDISPEEFSLKYLLAEVERTFSVLAKNKGIDFKIHCAVPDKKIFSDRMRLEQVLKNLISNAIKFTAKGSVEITVTVNDKIPYSAEALCFAVKDTGIGIKDSQRDIIFEAFKQADGTTSRNFGGTGLGLSISQNLAKLLGGHIEVESEFGKGSIFRLCLPERYSETENTPAPIPEKPKRRIDLVTPLERPKAAAAASTPVVSETKPERIFIDDDRRDLKPESKVILIVEDDAPFALIMRDMAREMGFKALVADTAEQGLQLAESHRPLAVVLDIMLPDQNGLFVLDQLKQKTSTRHIPVHIISSENFSSQALGLGAIGYMLKPVKRDQLKIAMQQLESKAQKSVKRVLIVEDDDTQNEAIRHLISDDNVEIFSAKNGADALNAIKEKSLDCVILDLTLPDMSGLALLETLSEVHEGEVPPVIVYTGRDLSKDDEIRIRQFSKSIIIKGVKSPERLLDQVTLFLHQVEAKLPPDRQKILSGIRNRDKAIESKRILLVDDDLRNVFALTAALEQRGAKVVMAKNGAEALDILRKDPKFDLVLLDIMMPVMDGYQTLHEMRHEANLKKLPVIALTAKAMKDDREKALKAGADDYLAKPVDMEKLLSLIRVWTS